jgi:hypothetical protein
MSDKVANLPERLRVVGATDLERRLLAAAAREEPSPEMRQRMAAAIGISAGAIGAAATSSALSAGTAGAKAAGSSLLLPWLSASALVLTVAGVAIGVRLWSAPAAPPPRAHGPAVTSPAPLPAAPAAPAVAPVVAAPEPAAPPAVPHRRAASPSGDLGEQIALIDKARTAVASSAGERALELLRRYQDRYPTGSFRPEAAALRIEALAKLGRMSEARSLAQRFVAEHGASPLAARVARVAGLATP